MSIFKRSVVVVEDDYVNGKEVTTLGMLTFIRDSINECLQLMEEGVRKKRADAVISNTCPQNHGANKH